MSRRVTAIVVTSWCACVAAGLWAMLEYSSTPAKTLSSKSNWPAASRLRRDPNRPTLVMFVHPYCPCSRASLKEFSGLLSDCRKQVGVHVVFVKPAGLPEGLKKSALWRAAQQLPGVDVSCDVRGDEAAHFGATTSGEAWLYSQQGRLLFHGGLTRFRGHEGPNQGRAAIAALIDGAPCTGGRAAVYGCSLLNRRQKNRQGNVP
jgi:hypothetical protein